MVLVIANQKGGVGKTTTAVNLAACLAQKGKRVLLCDIDPQGNATSGLGFDKKQISRSIYHVLIDGVPAREAVISCGIEGLFLLPASIDLAGAEVELVSMMARETILARALAALEGEYDYILIDAPPSLGLLTVNAFAAADQLLIPIQCEFYALEGLSQLINTVKLVKRSLNPRLEIEGALLTMFDSRTNLSIQVVEEVKRFFGGKVHSTIVPRNVRLGEAPSHGLPITLYDNSCTGAEAYRDLADELIERMEEKGTEK